MILKVSEESARVKEQKEKITAENEKLQADTVSYVSLNTKLQGEKEQLQKAVSEGQKLIADKEKDLQNVNSRLSEIEKGLADKQSREHEALTKEKKVITKKVIELNSTLKKERALYHYNLGVAYANAKLYDDAITEYKSSLQADPDNADAHYNLAILYDAIESDPADSVEHYRKYLELTPNAEDRDEVEAILRDKK